ncbi:MAG: TMEM175 family protein [Saprospiraceae bacterium]
MSEKQRRTATEYTHQDLERVKMFSDAVFAIALTLLVLELKIPDDMHLNDSHAMWKGLREMMPQFKAFLLSAVLVGGNWISLMNLHRIMVKVDFFFLADLVLYLVIISLIPFCCELIGKYPDNPVSFIIFGGLCELLVVNAYFFIRHCRLKHLFHPEADLQEVKFLEKSLIVVSILLAIMIWIAFYSTNLSFFLFLVYNLIPFFVTRKLK